MSVERRGDGWRVRWREHGRPRSRQFRLKRDAEAWDREVTRLRQLGPLAVQQLTTTKPTLGEWIAERWAPEHAVTLEQSTRERYANAYEVHIAPWLDQVPLADLTVARLRQWQMGRLNAGVSAGTIDKCRTILSSILRHAAESEVILANPLPLVRAPKAPPRDAAEPLAPVTVEAIRIAMLDAPPREVAPSRPGRRRRAGYTLRPLGTSRSRQRDALIVSLLAYSGIRPGELRAMRWGDVRDKTIVVQRGADPTGKTKGTKTDRKRPVRLLAPLKADLAEYRLLVGRPPGYGAGPPR
jgi:integrase